MNKYQVEVLEYKNGRSQRSLHGQSGDTIESAIALLKEGLLSGPRGYDRVEITSIRLHRDWWVTIPGVCEAEMISCVDDESAIKVMCISYNVHEIPDGAFATDQEPQL